MNQMLTMIVPETGDIIIRILKGPKGERMIQVVNGDTILLAINNVKGLIVIEEAMSL